jgi:DNA polymerase I
MDKKLLIIDAHAVIHRAFHALPATLSSNGVPTNALIGFFTILHNTIKLVTPTHLVICFDTPVKTFRKELMVTYQNKRPHLDDNLRVQIPLIKSALDASGVIRLEKEGFEADDVIGTIATHAKTHKFITHILTGDKDILQLVNKTTFVVMPQMGANVKIFNEEAVMEKLGINAAQVTDYKALVGDSSDNYIGVKGIGPKTAIGLITKFGTVENLYGHVEEVENERIKNLLITQKESAILTKTIATIVKDVDVECNFDNTVFDGFNIGLKEYLLSYQASGIVQRLFPFKKEGTPLPIKPMDEEALSLF